MVVNLFNIKLKFQLSVNKFITLNVMFVFVSSSIYCQELNIDDYTVEVPISDCGIRLTNNCGRDIDYYRIFNSDSALIENCELSFHPSECNLNNEVKNIFDFHTLIIVGFTSVGWPEFKVMKKQNEYKYVFKIFQRLPLKDKGGMVSGKIFCLIPKILNYSDIQIISITKTIFDGSENSDYIKDLVNNGKLKINKIKIIEPAPSWKH